MVAADVGARYLVRNPFDVGLGQHFAQEFEFGGAGLTVLGRDSPDGAVVQGHPVGVVPKLLEGGEIPLVVEELDEARHLLIKALAGQLLLGLLDTVASAPIEDAGNEFWVFLLDVLEQLKREVAGGFGEVGLGQIGAVVEVGGPSGPAPGLTRSDEPGGLEGSQMLANAASGDPEGLREPFDRCFPAPLQGLEDLPPRRR